MTYKAENVKISPEAKAKAKLIAESLTDRSGPVLGGMELRRAMGFQAPATFEKAVRRGGLELKIFRMPGRRGYFALSQDVATWLVLQSELGDVTGHGSKGPSQPTSTPTN